MKHHISLGYFNKNQVLKKNPLKGVHQKSIFSIRSLKMKHFYNYAWGYHVGFLETSNPLVEMTFSIHKHNRLIVFKKSCVLTFTPN